MSYKKIADLEFKIGDIFYICVPDASDREFWTIYKGIVCGYNCSYDSFSEDINFEVNFYRTMILNCPQLAYRNIDEEPESGADYLDTVALVTNYDNQTKTLSLDINTNDEELMHEYPEHALEYAEKLWVEDSKEETEDSKEETEDSEEEIVHGDK